MIINTTFQKLGILSSHVAEFSSKGHMRTMCEFNRVWYT